MPDYRLRTKVWGWLSVIAAGFAVWHATRSITYNTVISGAPRGRGRNINCGSIFDPAFPLDGQGPCTANIEMYRGVFVAIALFAVFALVMWYRNGRKAS